MCAWWVEGGMAWVGGVGVGLGVEGVWCDAGGMGELVMEIFLLKAVS